MLHFDNIRSARLLIMLMKLVGMWTFQQSFWNILYRCYGWMLHLHFTFLFVAGMYVNAGMAQNLDDLSDALYMSLTETALIVKVLNIMIQSPMFVKCIEAFEMNVVGTPRNKEELVIVEREHAKFTRLRNMYIGGSMIVLAIAAVTPFLDGSYNLPFPCWIPFNYSNNQNYYYAYGFVMIGITVTAISNYTMDLVQSYMMLHLSIYYKLLGSRFANFGNKDNCDEEVLDSYFDFHGFITRIKHQFLSKIALLAKILGFNFPIYFIYISHYSLTLECEKFVSYPIFVQVILSAFVLCFTVFKLQNIPLMEKTAFMLYFTFAMIMLQIYLPCNYGNELTTSAHDLTGAVYASGWLHLSLDARKKMFVYMEYLKRPVVIRAGKIFCIGLGIFSQTMNYAYRLYAVLLSIQT